MEVRAQEAFHQFGRDVPFAHLQSLNSPPAAHVIAVGDTPYDAAAATKLGLRVIGVRCGGFPKQELLAAGCEAVFRDPQDLLQRYKDWIKEWRFLFAGP